MGVEGTETASGGSVAAHTPRQRRPWHKRPLFWIQVTLVTGIVLGSWLSLRSTVVEPALAAPSHIGDMKRFKVLTGEQAIAQMTSLHGKDVGVIDGYLAEYESGNEHMTLWVGLAGGEQEAEVLLGRMSAAIAQGGTGFTKPVTATIKGREVMATSGGDGMNYFFSASNSVVWVTLMNSPTPATRLNDVLNTVRFE